MAVLRSQTHAASVHSGKIMLAILVEGLHATQHSTRPGSLLEQPVGHRDGPRVWLTRSLAATGCLLHCPGQGATQRALETQALPQQLLRRQQATVLRLAINSQALGLSSLPAARLWAAGHAQIAEESGTKAARHSAAGQGIKCSRSPARLSSRWATVNIVKKI